MTADDVQYSLGRTVAAGLAGAYMLGRFLTKPFKQIKIARSVHRRVRPGPPAAVLPGGDRAGLQRADPGLAGALKAHAEEPRLGPRLGQPARRRDGPVHAQSWVAGQQIVLTRFAGYWGGWSGRHFSKIILRLVPDSTTRRELMERGQADLTFDLTPQDDDALKKRTARSASSRRTPPRSATSS